MPLDPQIVSAPVRNVPGNSNLSLLAAVTNYDQSMAPFESLPNTLSLDVIDFNLTHPVANPNGGDPILRTIAAIEINFESSRYYSVRPHNCDESIYRSWRKYRFVFTDGTEEAPEEYSRRPLEWMYTEWSCLANDIRPRPKVYCNMPLLEALIVYFTSYASNSVRYEAAAGLDPLAPLREMAPEMIAGFVTWLFHHDTLGENYTTLHPLELALAWFTQDYHRIADGRASRSVGIGLLEGAGRARIIHKVERCSNYVDHEDAVEQDLRADVIDEDGVFHSRTQLTSLGIVPFSDAWYAAVLATKCEPLTIRALNHRRGVADTFGDVSELEGDNPFRELVNFIGEDSVQNATVWAKMIGNFRTVGGLPVVAPVNFDLHWISKVIDRNSFNVSQSIGDSLRYGQRIDISAVDIAEFAKTSIPENGLVKHVKMLKNGKVRVVLKEPVYPEFVQRRGATYTENEPGTVLSYMAVHAFDLDFRGTLTQFPNATAYADEECTQTARHTNITSCGRVCLGDINTQMSKEEVAARGGVAMPCVADFVQMLKQCNLDSAYNSGKDFVLLDPSSVTDEQWRAREWDIPGLRRVDQHMNDFRAFMEAMSRAAPASEGQAAETAATEEEGEAE